MRSRPIVFAILLLVTSLALWLPRPSDGAGAFPAGRFPAVSGLVVDTDGRRIRGARIQVWYDGVPSKRELRTSSAGTYDVPSGTGRQLSLVFFHDDFHPMVVGNISGRHENRIVTALYQPDDKRWRDPRLSLQATYDQLEAFERLIFLSLNAEGSDRYRTLDGLRRQSIIERVRDLPVPSEAKKGLTAVRLVAEKKERVSQAYTKALK